MFSIYLSFCAWASVAAAGYLDRPPAVLPRTVASLDQAATAEAQQRDDTATRAFSNVRITTADGQRCLFVDPLSGDFRANLTPIQLAACDDATPAGQGWDVITAGKHIDASDNAMLVVSTLTQACFNVDPRRAAGNQVLLFSCGGRADGSGQVTNSQLFAFNGTAGPLSFEPGNVPGSCLTAKGNTVDIATCDPTDADQLFVFGGAASSASSAPPPAAAAATNSATDSATDSATEEATSASAAVAATSTSARPTGCAKRRRRAVKAASTDA
ncbi:Ricin B-related lectin [Niveomyces insectorum RCEF 264]|uniref:Ricin B-related lectin n=1 Tax=Niveomyces insectorum RCEF 264 TaxID=1081102 RepID=A0A167UU66_9HYPO|nr:Ricin B-related lectin [Niveomyces insectorum RCEF 264]